MTGAVLGKLILALLYAFPAIVFGLSFFLLLGELLRRLMNPTRPWQFQRVDMLLDTMGYALLAIWLIVIATWLFFYNDPGNQFSQLQVALLLMASVGFLVFKIFLDRLQRVINTTTPWIRSGVAGVVLRGGVAMLIASLAALTGSWGFATIATIDLNQVIERTINIDLLWASVAFAISLALTLLAINNDWISLRFQRLQ